MNTATLAAVLILARDWSGYTDEPQVVRVEPEPALNWTLTELPEPTPRPNAQWLFFTSKSCPPCQAAKADMMPWLKASGWTEQHIRLVDVDDEPELVTQYNVETLPEFVLLVGGEEVKRYDTYPGRKTIADDRNAAFLNSKPITKSAAPKSGGTLKRAYVTEGVEWLKSLDGKLKFRRERKFPLGSMSATIPAGCEISWPEDGSRVNVSGPKPYIKWGVISQELSGVAIGERKVTLELPRMFDVSLEIEE